MKGKSWRRAATVEACEEAGIKGTALKKPLGTYAYWKRLSDRFVSVVVTVYVLPVAPAAWVMLVVSSFLLWVHRPAKENAWCPGRKMCHGSLPPSAVDIPPLNRSARATFSPTHFAIYLIGAGRSLNANLCGRDFDIVGTLDLREHRQPSMGFRSRLAEQIEYGHKS
jgi:hypothetical protein